MITVNCKDDDSKSEEKNIYPCLKVHKHNGRKVLFVAHNDGYQISASKRCNGHLMYRATSWEEDSLYTLYTGTIELRNG